MKVSTFPLLFVGAGLAVLQATASPIRVVVVTSHQEVSSGAHTTSNLRFGHAVASGDAVSDPNVAHFIRPGMKWSTSTAELQAGPKKHHCMGAALREKAFKLSNAFRHAFGLPLIEKAPHHGAQVEGGKKIHGGLVHILPMPFIGTPDLNVAIKAGDVAKHNHIIQPLHPIHPHKASFLRRIHRALMALGPWEGRAVAFVLGCGIGVLLRMIWVMTVVTYRVIRGEPEETQVEYTALVFEDAEDIAVPPPQYTDEKVAAAVADVKASEEEA